jgi:hypothetical protein
MVMRPSCTPQRPRLNLVGVFGCSDSSVGQSRGPLITPGRSHLGGCTLAAVSCVLREPMPLFRRGQVAGLVCYWSHSVPRRGRRPTVYRGELAISLGRKNLLKTNEARWKTCVEQSGHREVASLNACFEKLRGASGERKSARTFDTNKGGDSHGRLRQGSKGGSMSIVSGLSGARRGRIIGACLNANRARNRRALQ